MDRMITRRGSLFRGAAVVTLALAEGSIASAQTSTDPGLLTSSETRAIGKEVFLWGMHPVAIYHQRYNTVQNEQSPKYVGLNRFSWYRKPIVATDRFATTPNATTLYGTAILDLAREPVVVTVPEI